MKSNNSSVTEFLKFLAIIFGAYFLLMIFTGVDYFDGVMGEQPTTEVEEPVQIVEVPQEPMTLAQPEVPVQATEAQAPEVPAPSIKELTAEDLLPKYDEANDFAEQNPVSQLLQEQNFLVSGYHAGINTVMQSNKIPYHDIRSAPPIPKEAVGPWSQSSYETPAGGSRRVFEIGA